MSERMHRPDEVGYADQETVHHEESDVNVRAIFGFVIGLLAVGIVVHLAMWGLMAYFDSRRAAANSIREFPLAAAEARVPPSPRLQETPRLDMQNLRAREEELLSGYGWVDKSAGTVRIPIEQAMKLTVERGLPVRGTAPPEPPEEPGK